MPIVVDFWSCVDIGGKKEKEKEKGEGGIIVEKKMRENDTKKKSLRLLYFLVLIFVRGVSLN